jgi:hypothetical protein
MATIRRLHRVGLSCLLFAFSSFVISESFFQKDLFAQEALIGQIQIENKYFNFGTVSEGQIVEHEFKFRNSGNADLQILRVVSTCGCTAAVANDSAVPPGVENSIKVSFDSSGFSGKVAKQVRVYTTDLSNKEITLTLEGQVERLVKIIPAKIDFGKVVAGIDVEAKELEVRTKSSTNKKLKSLKSFSKYLKITQKPSRHDASSAEDVTPFLIELDPKAPFGAFRDRLLVEFSDSKAGSVINVPVLAQIEGPILIEPKQLSFGLIQGKDLLERKLRIENRSNQHMEIKSITSDSRAIEVTSKVIEPGRLFVLNVKLSPENVRSDLRGLLRIETSLLDTPEILVSVFGVVAPKQD